MKRLPLAALLLCCCLFAQQPGSLPKKLKTLLSKQGFSGQIEGKVNFRRLEPLNADQRSLKFSITHGKSQSILVKPFMRAIGSCSWVVGTTTLDPM